MATKTISLEVDAYEKLKAAKSRPSESFSEVVRRAGWEKKLCTAQDLLRLIRESSFADCLPSAENLDRLTRAQHKPRRSATHWDTT